MDSTKLNDWMQVVGIFALVASLIFVGLQMKQSQEIAIASQYHDRAALAVENFNAQLESGNLVLWGKFTGKIGDFDERSGDLANLTSDWTAEEWGRFYLSGVTYLTQADNHFFQYQSGFMEDEAWQAQRATLRRVLRNSNSPPRVALVSSRSQYRSSFLALADKLIEENDAEAEEHSVIQ